MAPSGSVSGPVTDLQEGKVNGGGGGGTGKNQTSGLVKWWDSQSITLKEILSVALSMQLVCVKTALSGAHVEDRI